MCNELKIFGENDGNYGFMTVVLACWGDTELALCPGTIFAGPNLTAVLELIGFAIGIFCTISCICFSRNLFRLKT